jgi:hypothetical protein
MLARFLAACALVIRQRLAKMDNEIGVSAGGPVIGGNRNYWGAGVHAPN